MFTYKNFKFKNIAFLIYKTFLFFFVIIFIEIFSVIIFFSIKPRKIEFLDKYLTEKIKNNDSDFFFTDSTVQIKKIIFLQYKIEDFDYHFKSNYIKINDLIFDINLIKLLFGKINFKKISANELNLNINLNNKINYINENNEIKIEDQIELITKKIINNPLKIKNFDIKNIIIKYDINNNNDNNILIKNFNLKIIKILNKLFLKQRFKLTINNNIENNIKISCDLSNFDKICSSQIKNINLNDFYAFFYTDSKYYNWFKNINTLFNINFNFIFNEKNGIKSGKFIAEAKNGNFFLKDFFDENINFKDLNIDLDILDNLNIVNINSIKTNFDGMDFFMSLFYSKNNEYKNIDLIFDIKNVKLKRDLKRLWPNFLGEKDIRPWVIEHFVDGFAPEATAEINLKYYNDESKQSGLQKVYSKVNIENTDLDYSSYFPKIKNINGELIFTENGMKSNIISANVLNSKIKDSSVNIDWSKDNTKLDIFATINGPLSDIFIHIDKNDAKSIKESINYFIDDKYTNSKLNLTIPLSSDINLNSVRIDANLEIFNKSNSVLRNDSNIIATLLKKENTMKFIGKIDLTNNQIVYIPLNLIKNKNDKLIFNYEMNLKNDIFYITKFNPISDYINFNLNGKLDFNKKINTIKINNLKLNNSNCNVEYVSFFKNKRLINNIIINGNSMDYSNIINNVAKYNLKEVPKISNFELNIFGNLKYIYFKNNKKIINPKIHLTIKNGDFTYFQYFSSIGENKYFNIELKQGNFHITSNDYGKLFNIIDLTNKIINGEGKLEIKNDYKNQIISGEIVSLKNFKINLIEDIANNLAKNSNDENLDNLKSIKNKKMIDIRSLETDFEYKNNKIYINNTIADSNDINLKIIGNGYIDINTMEIDIQGLAIPYSWINGMFGLSKIPVIGKTIFGEKNAGLFSSKFSIYKKDANTEANVKFSAFSTFFPSHLRNIFSVKQNAKKN